MEVQHCNVFFQGVVGKLILLKQIYVFSQAFSSVVINSELILKSEQGRRTFVLPVRSSCSSLKELIYLFLLASRLSVWFLGIVKSQFWPYVRRQVAVVVLWKEMGPTLGRTPTGRDKGQAACWYLGLLRLHRGLRFRLKVSHGLQCNVCKGVGLGVTWKLTSTLYRQRKWGRNRLLPHNQGGSGHRRERPKCSGYICSI